MKIETVGDLMEMLDRFDSRTPVRIEHPEATIDGDFVVRARVIENVKPRVEGGRRSIRLRMGT